MIIFPDPQVAKMTAYKELVSLDLMYGNSGWDGPAADLQDELEKCKTELLHL